MYTDPSTDQVFVKLRQHDELSCFANGQSRMSKRFTRDSAFFGNPVLTVALTPVPKVDYSVTKGGARTWVVLLVFVFLCSSLYTIFSAKDIESTTADLNGDDADDSESSYNAAQPISSNRCSPIEGDRPTLRCSQNDDEDDAVEEKEVKKALTPTSAQKNAVNAQVDDDEDEADEVDYSLGSRLFAGLKKKITSRLTSITGDEPKPKKESRRQPKPSPPQKAIQPPSKPKRKVEPIVEVEEEPKNKQNSRKHVNRHDRNKEKLKSQVDDDADNDDDDDDDDDEDDDDEGNDGNSEKEEEKSSAKESGDAKKTEEAEKDDDGKDDDDDGDDKTISPMELRRIRRQQQKEHRKMRASSSRGECVHMDCPSSDGVKPRMSLLRKKHRFLQIDDFPEDDDNDEDEDEDGTENDEPVDDVDGEEACEQSKSERDAGNSYKRHAITTKQEIGFRDILDRADQLVEKHDYEAAIELFDHVIAVYPYSSRAYFGKARAYDIRGEKEAREKYRNKAIAIYEKILRNPTTPEALFRQTAQRLIDRTRFSGDMHKCLQAHRIFIDRFPDELGLQCDFAITFIMMKRYEDARVILKNILANDPNNVLALAYYGYILKAQDNRLEQGVALMKKSLKLAHHEIKDPKFFYQLGHGLVSLGRKSEADAVYAKAAEMGVFITAQQRSLYNIDGLTARPWWTLDQTPYSKFLKSVERQWATIRQESMAVLRDCDDCWLDHNQHLVIDGQWRYFPIMAEQIFIRMYLSVLSSGGQIIPHCGPTNYHLQAHLGLVVPSEARIRVGNETRGWKSGKFIVFDDSFENEMRFDGASSSSFRLALVLQLWHPEVQPHQRVLSFLS